MIKRYTRFLGLEQTIKLLEANEKSLNPTIRVNTLKISPEELRERLENKGFALKKIERVPYGYQILEQPLNLGSLHEYLQGYYFIQNMASMLPALILNPLPEQTVIDMCAAPGSKATQLAQIMQNNGSLILIDRNKKRIPALQMNLRRLGISNDIVINMDSAQLLDLGIKADKILLDAPCTGEGLIVQDKSRKKSKTLKDIEKMARIQKKLLTVGLETLKPGGKLVYSTCSIGPEENELVINSVLKDKNQYAIKKIKTQYGISGLTSYNGVMLNKDLKFSQRLYPHLHETIGFYLCLIERI